MFNSKEKKETPPKPRQRLFLLKANGIGVYHTAPAIFMIAAGMALSIIINDVCPGAVKVFASSVSAGINNVREVEVYSLQPSLAELNDGKTSIELNYVPTLHEELIALKREAPEETYDFSKHCSYVTSEAAAKKLAATAEKNTLARELSEARGQKVISSNRNLYLDTYGYQRGYSNIPSITGACVGVNSAGIPMSQMKAPDSLKLDENGVPLNYYYYIDGKATAYYGGTITATGSRVRQGVVAVDPRKIPYGTEMYITSLDGKYVYGFCRAEDTGGFIYFKHGPTADLYMQTYADCCLWGLRNVRIYILPTSYK